MSHDSVHNRAARAARPGSGMYRATEPVCSALKPIRKVRARFPRELELLQCDGWRAALRFAMAESGETHLSLATALSMSRSQLTRMFDPLLSRSLTHERLERMREAAPECFRWFQYFMAEPLTCRRGA